MRFFTGNTLKIMMILFILTGAKMSRAEDITQPPEVAVLNKSPIEQSATVLQEAKLLIDRINSTTEDKTEFLDEIRSIRLKITKRSPQLRSYLDGLRDSRDRLNELDNSTAKFTEPLLSKIPTLEFQSDFLSNSNIGETDETMSTQDKIDILKAEIDIKRKENTEPLAIKKAEVELRILERRLSQETEANARFQEYREARDKKIIEDREKRKTEVEKLNFEISSGDSLSQELDDTLNILDDISGSLLESYRRSAEYTDRSTIVFAVLVGGVIFGFFAVAFFSENVRNAIFTGDSGIQFVTMFSLVIAIILFGVLKILEGKELSALLGGLSGYILGRGSLGTTPKPKQVDP